MKAPKKDECLLAVSFARIAKLFPGCVKSKEEGAELLRRWQEFVPNKEVEFLKTLNEANEFGAMRGFDKPDLNDMKKGILAIADYFEEHGARFTAVHMRILAGSL